jgi:hypothetical protein
MDASEFLASGLDFQPNRAVVVRLNKRVPQKKKRPADAGRFGRVQVRRTYVERVDSWSPSRVAS